MDRIVKAIMAALFDNRNIGGSHTNKENLLRKKTKWLRKEEYKEFEKSYRQALREELMLRVKKRTWKGSDWHISLNPKKLKEIHEIIDGDEKDERIL